MGNPTQLWTFFSYRYTWAIDVLSRRFRFHDMVKFEANPLFGEEIFGVAVVTTTTSGTAIHPIDTRSDESNLIDQRYVIERGFVCIGDTICGDKGLRSHLLSVENECSCCAQVLRQSVFAFHIEGILPISRSKHVESAHINAY